jgi:hypothetical protein
MSRYRSQKLGAALVIGGLLLICLVTPLNAINVQITSTGANNFPVIHVLVRALDDSGNFIEDLGSANFELRENGVLVNYAIIAQTGYMAASLVMDKSGSMQGQEPVVIAACSAFVAGMDPLDKGSVIKFSDRYSTFISVPMTYDKDRLLDSIQTYQTGGSTALWYADSLAIVQCQYEPEKKAVVTFTDGQNNQSGPLPDQLPLLAGDDITMYYIGIGQSIDSTWLSYVAQQTGGFYLHISTASQMQQVLLDIRQDIGDQYDLYYTTPDQNFNGSTRPIEVVFNYQGQSAWDTASYTAPVIRPPIVTLSSSTAALLGVSQPAGASLDLACTIQSNATISAARIYYKTVGDLTFNQANLVHGSGTNWSYTLPASAMVAPGVEFYLQASDNYYTTVTVPPFNPSSLPLSIPVQPNQAPTLACTPPTEWLTGRSLPLEVTVVDPAGSIQSVTLYYRVPSLYYFNSIPMTDPNNDDKYQAIIEGPNLDVAEDLEIFIAARDNDEVMNYWHSSYNSYHLEVVNELPPTPPVVTLESQLPITIPASGGSFNYTWHVINPAATADTCDVWADWILPGGSVVELGVLPGGSDVILAGGQSQTHPNTQAVAASEPAGEYTFRIHSGLNSSGEVFFTASFPFTKLGNDFGLGPAGPLPADRLALGTGYPNPFNAVTSLQYNVPQSGHVTLLIHDVAGREVARLMDGNLSAGLYTARWDASGVSSGLYFCTLISGKSAVTTRLSLLK